MKRILLTLGLIATVAYTQAMDVEQPLFKFAFDSTKKPDTITIDHFSVNERKGFIKVQLKNGAYSETLYAHYFRCQLGNKQEYSTFRTNSLGNKPEKKFGKDAQTTFNSLRSLCEQVQQKKILAAQQLATQTTEGKQ